MRYKRNSGRLTSYILFAVMAALVIGLGLPGTAEAVWEYGWKQTDATGTSSGTTTRDCYMALQAPNTSNMRIVGVGHKVGSASGGGRFCIYFDTDADPSTGGSTLQGETGQVSTTTTAAWVWFGLTSPVDLPANQYLGLTYTGNNGGMSYWYDNTSTGCASPALAGGCLGDALSFWQPGRATTLTYADTPASTYPTDGTSYGYTYSSHLIYVLYPTLTSPPTSLVTNQTGVALSGAGFETQNQFNGTTYGSFYTGTTSKVLLSSSSTWGAGTVVAQTINSWNDTSINFDVVQGGLSTGTVYLWVENSDGEHSSPQTVTLSAPGPVTTAPGTVTLSVVSDTQINVSMPYTDNTDTDGNCSVQYSTTGVFGGEQVTATGSPFSGASPRSCSITGLNPGTLYYVRVVYTDPDGISGGQPATQTVSDTTTYNGTTKGTLSKIGATSTTITVSVTFTGDNDTDNGCTIRVNDGGWTALTTTKNGSTYEATATGLSELTSYDFDATFTDADGVYPDSSAVTGNFSTGSACDAVVDDCSDCHTMPPSVDSHNIGAHQGDSSRSACAVCHFRYPGMVSVTSTARWTTGHTNDYLDIYTSAGVNGGIRGGGYKGYRNASSLWKDGAANSNNICANSYCHGSTSPVWGTTGGVTCTTCHNNPPTDVGSHGEHTSGTYADSANHSTSGANDYGCRKCHPAALHSTGPADANAAAFVAINYSSAPTQSGGTYTVGSSQGNDSRGFEWSNSTCSNAMYCHSSGEDTPAVANTTPTWGTAMSGCASCHDDATSLATQTHDEHINNPDTNLANYGCVTCHNATVSNDTTVNNKANHVNGTQDVSMSAGSYNGTNCSNTACHNTGQATPTYLSPAWGGSAIGCNGCHGTNNYYTDINGMPDYQNVSTASRNTFNGHQVTSHVSAATDCVKCHDSTVTSAGAIKASSLHLDGSRDVVFAAGGSYANKRCSGTDAACHGAVTPRWGGALDCYDCHIDTGSIGTELDNYTYGSGGKATINELEWQNAGHGRTTAYPYTGNSGASLGCLSCHDSGVAHNTSSNPFRLTNANTNTLCGTCHNTSVANHHTFAVIDPVHSGGSDATWTFTPKCVDCHDPHGDNGGLTTGQYNAAMIHSAVNSSGSDTYGVPAGTTNVDFPTGFPGGSFVWASFVDSSSPYNGLCQVCHIGPNTANYFNSALYTSGHNSGVVCDSCHPHPDGFAGAGGSCTGCHGTGGSGVGGAKNRRNIETDFTMNSHHINATSGLWANVDTTSCAACHPEGNFADGSINATYHNDGVVHLKQWSGTFPTTGNNGTFTVATFANGTTTKATNHCLSCHNATNAAATPFSASGDSGTPSTYDTASGGTNAGSIAVRYSATNTTYFSKYSPTTNNVVPQLVKAYSPHGNASNNQRGVATTGAWSNDGGSTNTACMDCHNSHGSNAGSGGTSTSYSSSVGGYGAGILYNRNGYTPTAGSGTPASYAASSDLCWDCHLGDQTAPKDYNTGFNNNAPIVGYYDGTGRWTNANGDDWSGSFSYKTAGTTGGKDDGQQKGGHFGASSALTKTTPSAQVSGRCTACHDPHGINPSKTDAQYYVPALKGAWMTSPYKEDRAPGTQGANFSASLTGMDSYWYTGYTNRSGDTTQWKPVRFSPRFDTNNPPTIGAGYGTGISGSSNWDVGGTGGDGYFIDENTFGTNITYGGSNRSVTDTYTTATNGERPWIVTTVTPNRISQADTQFAGLCLGCHTKTSLEGVASSNGTDTQIKVHNTVKGWYQAGNATDLFKDANAAEHLMSYRNNNSNSNSNRCTYVSQGISPYIMPAGYRWGVVPGNTTVSGTTHTPSNPPDTTSTQSVSGYKQNAYHQFPCSKCHTAHTSKLPRLMKTNCIDVGTSSSYPKHRGGSYDYPANCDQGYTDNAGVLVDVMMECHNLKKSNTSGGGGWNIITGW